MLEFLAQRVRLAKLSDLFPISRAQLRKESVVFYLLDKTPGAGKHGFRTRRLAQRAIQPARQHGDGLFWRERGIVFSLNEIHINFP